MTYPVPSQQHPALLAYAARYRIAADNPPRSDGRLTVRVDGRWRVHLSGVAEGRTLGRIVLSARLLDLSGQLSQPLLGDLLVRLASLAAGRLKSDASSLSLDSATQALLLLEVLPASSDLEAVETGLADFVNALAFWGRAIEAEKPPSLNTVGFQPPPAFQTSQPLGSFASPHLFFP